VDEKPFPRQVFPQAAPSIGVVVDQKNRAHIVGL
jgi:hypothetical protein